MKTYSIYLRGQRIATGLESLAAYDAWEFVKELAKILDASACLVWDETGEEISCFPYKKRY